MAYPEHYLLQISGSLHGTEEWSNNLRLMPDVGLAVDETLYEQVFDDLEADCRAFFATSMFHTGLTVDTIKLNRIGPDGKYLDPIGSKTRFPAIEIRGTGSAAHPPQVALVATLKTAAARGYGSRGRIFLAGINQAQSTISNSDGRISEPMALNLQTNVQTFLNNINNWPGIDGWFAGLQVAVVSKGGLLGAGVGRTVTGVTMGRTLDTQRRRREDVQESYLTDLPVA